MCETLEWFLSLNGLGIVGILVFMIVIGLIIGVGIVSENQGYAYHLKNRQIRKLFEEISPDASVEVRKRLENILGAE